MRRPGAGSRRHGHQERGASRHRRRPARAHRGDLACQRARPRGGTRSRHRRGAARPSASRRAADRGDSRGRSSQIAVLGDPVGEVIDGHRLPNGLDVRKVRVPLGVVAVVYEARPNVTIDAAALCLKSGNAIVLRGSSSAAHSNAVLASIASRGRRRGGSSRRLHRTGRRRRTGGAGRACHAGRPIDLLIPRGGEGLKAALKDVASVPVIYAASGNCHVFVDASADLEEALERSCSTPRPSAPACATPSRRCLSMRTSRRQLSSRSSSGVRSAATSRLGGGGSADFREEDERLTARRRRFEPRRAGHRRRTGTPSISR